MHRHQQVKGQKVIPADRASAVYHSNGSAIFYSAERWGSVDVRPFTGLRGGGVIQRRSRDRLPRKAL
jgi:hypothetical protein